MVEFVQRHLEELLPAFTGLQRTKILSDDEEVKTLIQKFRQFEYSVNKRTKRANDYLKFGKYLSDLLELISIRRRAIDIKQKRDDIEKPLKLHAANLFRICSERFKKAEYYQKEIDFLNKNAMFHILAKTYARLLQFHGTNPRNHEQAGRWEYFESKSAENAHELHRRSEATDADYKRLLDLATLEYFGNDVEKNPVTALKKNEKGSKLWAKHVEFRVNGFLDKDIKDRKTKEAKNILDLLDLALESIPSKEALPIWEYLIEFSVAHFHLFFCGKSF